MNATPDFPGEQPLDRAAEGLLQAVLEWQRGDAGRDAVVWQLSVLPDQAGPQVKNLISELLNLIEQAAPTAGGPHHEEDLESWRHELMSSRAKAWPFPDSCGMLVGPTVLLLTDGHQGVILRESRLRALPGTTAASLMLLAQTIVMAQHAVNQKELEALQHQRVESASTSLSEIEPIT